MAETLNIQILLAISLTVGFVTLSRLLFGSMLAPLGAYSLIWGGCIFLHGLDLLNGFTSIADATFVIIYSSWLAYFLGSIFSIVVYYKRLDQSVAKPAVVWAEYLAAQRPRVVRLMYFLNAISLLIAIAVLVDVLSALGGFKGYLENAMKLRWEVADPSYHSGIEYSKNILLHTVGVGVIYLSCVLGAISLAAYRRHLVLSLIPVFAMFVFSVASISREHLIDVILVYVFGYWLVQLVSGRSSRIPWVIAAKVVLPVLALIVGMSVILGKLDDMGVREESATTALAEHFYYRLTIPIENLNNYVQNDEVPYYAGQATLNPLFRLMYAIGLTDSYVRIDNREVSPLSGSTAVLTYSYLKWPYDDFGLAGPPIIAFAFGFIASLLFLIVRSRLSIANIMVCIMLYDAIGYSFATWRFQDIFFVAALTFVVVAAVAGRWHKGASKRVEIGDEGAG